MAEKTVRIEGDLQTPLQKNLSWVQGDSVTVEAVVNQGGRLFKNTDSAFTQLKFYVDDNVATAAFDADTGTLTLPSGIAAKYAASGFDYELRLEGDDESVTIAYGKVLAAKSLSVVDVGDVMESKLHVLAQTDLTALQQHAGALENYLASSTTSQAIVGSGEFTLTVESGRDFQTSDEVTVLYTDDPTIYMVCDVVSYVGTTLTLDAQVAVGTGTYAKWKIFKSFLSGNSTGATIDDGVTAADKAWSSTKINTELGTRAAASHTHVIGDVTGLQTALDGKTATGHGHVISDVSGLQTALDSKQAAGSYANASHTHPLSEITQSGATTGQVPKWNGSAWAPAAEAGGSSNVNASALVAGQVAFGNGTELVGSENFTVNDATKTLMLRWGGLADQMYKITATEAELEILNGAAWATLQIGTIKPQSGGGINLSGTLQQLFNVSSGTTYVSPRHRFSGGHIHLSIQAAAPAGANMNNGEMVFYNDAGTIKAKFKNESGVMHTITMPAPVAD